MQTIDLECPQCQTLLELDAGFAGGVCRCSNCGTLMTVPADPRREKAETLTRPDRPDAPTRRPTPPRSAPTPRTPPSKPAAKAPAAPPPKKPAAPPAPARPTSPPAAAQPPAKHAPPPAPVKPPPTPVAPAQPTATVEPASPAPVAPTSPAVSTPPAPVAPPSQTITAPPATPPLAPPPPSEEEAEVAVEAEEDTPDEATVSAEVSASPAAAEPAPTEQTQAQTAEHSATPATAHDESADTQTYVTASGKVIRVSRANAIPTARKKREVVRFSVVLIVLLFLGAVIGATVFAVMLLRGGERQPEVQQENVREAMGGFDPNVNPFKMPRANYLGITFRSRTAIVIDTGPQISQWRSLAKDAILPGLEKVGNDTQLQIVFAAEKGGAAAYPETPRALTGPAEKDALKKFIDTIEPVGNASPAPAIRKALEGNPQQVIYVTGKSLGNDEINAIASEFNGKGGVRFDTVMIDTEATELAAVVKRQNGRYITPTRQVLVKWFGEIEPKPGE